MSSSPRTSCIDIPLVHLSSVPLHHHHDCLTRLEQYSQLELSRTACFFLVIDRSGTIGTVDDKKMFVACSNHYVALFCAACAWASARFGR